MAGVVNRKHAGRRGESPSTTTSSRDWRQRQALNRTPYSLVSTCTASKPDRSRRPDRVSGSIGTHMSPTWSEGNSSLSRLSVPAKPPPGRSTRDGSALPRVPQHDPQGGDPLRVLHRPGEPGRLGQAKPSGQHPLAKAGDALPQQECRDRHEYRVDDVEVHVR